MLPEFNVLKSIWSYINKNLVKKWKIKLLLVILQQPLFNMNAMQAPMPPANMPIPDPAILAGMPIPPTANSSQIHAPHNNLQENTIPHFSNLQIGQSPPTTIGLQQNVQEAFTPSA